MGGVFLTSAACAKRGAVCVFAALSMESRPADKAGAPLAKSSRRPRPSKCMTCCVNFSKTVMVTINIFFLIFGAILAGVSGWALANENALADLIPRTGLFMVLGAAFVLAIVASVGIYGALDEDKVGGGTAWYGTDHHPAVD